MSSLAQSILTIAQSLPEGGLLSPKEFLHLGSRAAVDQTLSRLRLFYRTGDSPNRRLGTRINPRSGLRHVRKA